MRTRVAFGLIAAASAIALAGCGLFSFEEREPWRDQVEARCIAEGRVVPTSFIQQMREISGPGVCGLVHPFKVHALADGAVSLSAGATLGCPMMQPLEAWLREVVQPAAMASFGMPVVELKIAAAYGCRPRNNRRGAKLSEHAFGNALDVGAFVLADGRSVQVKSGWRGSPEEQYLLHAAHGGACNYFTTVLGPGSDSHHSDHIHMDLARHDARGTRRYCRPVPRLPQDPYGVAMSFAPGADGGAPTPGPIDPGH